MEVCGVIEEVSMSSAPARVCARTPSSPYTTASTCGEAGTIVQMTLASSTASATEDAAVPPLAANRASPAASSVYPVTS
jgi:hypothetical protein